MLSFSQIYFLREEGVPEADKRVEIRVVLGCVFNFTMCSEVI